MVLAERLGAWVASLIWETMLVSFFRGLPMTTRAFSDSVGWQLDRRVLRQADLGPAGPDPFRGSDELPRINRDGVRMGTLSSDSQRAGRDSRADALDRAAQAWRAGVSWNQLAAPRIRRQVRGPPRRQPACLGNLQPSRDLARVVWRTRGEMVWRQALADVLDRRPGAVRAALSLMQRASALDGLDALAHEDWRTPAYAEIARWAA